VLSSDPVFEDANIANTSPVVAADAVFPYITNASDLYPPVHNNLCTQKSPAYLLYSKAAYCEYNFPLGYPVFFIRSGPSLISIGKNAFPFVNPPMNTAVESLPSVVGKND